MKRLMLASGAFWLCLTALAQPACLQQAATHYKLPLDLLSAILRVEGGRPGLAVRNTNGSFDLGPMQINTVWLSTLKPRGITLGMLRDDYCVNVAVASWILARELQRLPNQPSRGQVWQAVGSYHSHTPEYNYRYATRLWQTLKTQPNS